MMNGVQSRRVHNVEKPFPGCLGRMVNLFDLTSAVSGNKLLTDKPHHDAASSLSRSQSDVARIATPSFGDQIVNKLVVSDSVRASSKINGTPIKMLIDQEMSKEIVSKHNPPNVVAKLMGLEGLPQGEPNLDMARSNKGDYSQHMCSHSETPFRHWQLEDRYMDKEMLHEAHPSTEQTAYRNIYEIWLRSQRTNNARDRTPERERWGEDANARKMAFVRQKFMEAKRLSTDERLRQSKEFAEALEVLSSNNDLLIRLLDSQNLYELQSTPPAETKRITVLKPTKMVDNEKSSGKGKKNDKQTKKQTNFAQTAAWGKTSPVYSPASQKADEFPVQPTRIVVLKPSAGKNNDIKAVVSSATSSPQNLHSGNFYHAHEDCDALESRKLAKDISQHLHENLRSHQREETLYSVFSNGYIGDESSFNKSDHEDTAGNFSDMEVMSPSLRHSWDYINRCGSPYSSSSFSRASCSPESSVCREAKKRLSERWSIMASNKVLQEQRHLGRSSTLGEMLALSDVKKSMISEDEDINKDQEPSKSGSCSRNFNEEICMEGSPKNLVRSKSVPVSSTFYEAGPSIEVCDHDAGKAHGSKELTKSKSMKSSFKGKVTSLFFSRNKKPIKEKSCLSHSKDEAQSTATQTSVSPVSSPGALRDGETQSFNSGAFGECSVPVLYGLSSKNLSDSISNGQSIISLEPGLTALKPAVPENQDQPSPISVLEPPFEDENAANESLDCMKGGLLGSRLLQKSNLIDKSPPIESIARTLSWDDSCVEVASPFPLKPSLVSLDTKVEEQDWLDLVDELLSAAQLDDQVHCYSFYSRWHSLNSPLDPSLRDNYANLNDKEPQPLHEARRRQRRSNQKLVFDCVNVALMEITRYGSEKYIMGRLWSGSSSFFRLPIPEGEAPPLVDLIVAQMKELISSGIRSVWGDCGDSSSLVVESIVRKEVVGNEWIELMGLEIDILVKEVEGKLLEELVEDAVVDLTGMA